MAQATITTVDEGRIVLTDIGGAGKSVCLEIHRKLITGAYEVRSILLSHDEFKQLHADIDTFSCLPKA